MLLLEAVPSSAADVPDCPQCSPQELKIIHVGAGAVWATICAQGREVSKELYLGVLREEPQDWRYVAREQVSWVRMRRRVRAAT